MRKTKIICTIGPASRSADTIARLVSDGMDVARLNFSHGTREEHAAVLRTVRDCARRLGRPVAVLQDLAGSKIRCGEIAGGSVLLQSGGTIVLTPRPVPGDAGEIPVTDPSLAGVLRRDDPVLLADGNLELSVIEVRGADVVCRVVVGGVLSSGKGINLPSRSIDAPPLTAKDRADLEFGLAQGVDYIGLSFVRSAKDVLEARRFAESLGREARFIAKIERHEALGGIDAILDAADGIMVARGDLGVETPLEHVPVLQKLLIARANRVGKSVITATQMLRSMVENPRPTRAEVSDVANAVLDGTDAVMLSEESAVGRYPVEATRMLARIAEDVERSPAAVATSDASPRLEMPEAVAEAACRLASNVGAAAIVAPTRSGMTPRLMARFRPRVPILAPTHREEICRRLALVWGITPIEIPEAPSEEAIGRVLGHVRETGLVEAGDRVVVVGGLGTRSADSGRSIRVLVVPQA